ncbi:hypothetical protein CVT24_012643 [Panaeolus cyanescens]|uniref:DUF6535 domain-containing protein n=1 Tax=Panaeolus cyanescens TaxID=181874 RepID=A0A409W2E3_9AGAR|nr:hypothetical protein CVT24_012643 [Panaeolus cyanescens]
MSYQPRPVTPIPQAIRLSGNENDYPSPTIDGYGAPETDVNYRRGPVRPPSTAYSDAPSNYRAEYPSWLPFDPNKGLDEPYTFPFPSINGDPWENTFKIVKELDDTMCDDWVEEIQSLLIFAGLFSAVVTAFAVETQKLLQPDTGVGTIVLLAQLASRQSESNSSMMFDPSAITEPYLESLNSPSQSLRINTFIFVSLILSLGTALVGTLSLQWIRSYRKRLPNPYPDQLAIRYNRYIGLVGWKVPEIITSLSLVIQVSLVIFFVGIIDFLHSLNASLAIIAAAIVSLILAFVSFTTMAPGIHTLFVTKLPDDKEERQCKPLVPFQSPQAWIVFRGMLYIKQAYDWIWHRKAWKWSLTGGQSWNYLLSNYGLFCNDLRGSALAWVFQNCNGDHAFYNAYHCFRDLPPLTTAKQVVGILDPEGKHAFQTNINNMIPLYGGRNREPWRERETLSYNILTWDLRGRNLDYETPRRPVRQHLHELEARLHIDFVRSKNELADQLFTPWPKRKFEEMDDDSEMGNTPPDAEKRFVYQQKLSLFSLLTRLHSRSYTEYAQSMEKSFYELWNAILQESAAEERVLTDAIRVLKAWLLSLPFVRAPGSTTPRPVIVDLMNTLIVTCAGFSPHSHDGHPVTPESIERVFTNRYFHDFLDRFIENPELLQVWQGILRHAKEEVRREWDLRMRTYLQRGMLEPHHRILAYDLKPIDLSGYMHFQGHQENITFAAPSRHMSFVSGHEVYYGAHFSESPEAISAALPSPHPEQSVLGGAMGSALESAYGVLSSSAVEDSNRSTNILESPIPRRPEKWQQQEFSRIIRPPTPFKRARNDTDDTEDTTSTVTDEAYELDTIAIPQDAPPLSSHRLTGFYSAYSLPMVARSDDPYSEPRVEATNHPQVIPEDQKPEDTNANEHPQLRRDSSWDDSHFRAYQKSIMESSPSTTLSVHGQSSGTDQ